MIPKACKRLAEVDFPIAEVSKHAAREKSIQHGHQSTPHLWWTRRPLPERPENRDFLTPAEFSISIILSISNDPPVRPERPGRRVIIPPASGNGCRVPFLRPEGDPDV